MAKQTMPRRGTVRITSKRLRPTKGTKRFPKPRSKRQNEDSHVVTQAPPPGSQGTGTTGTTGSKGSTGGKGSSGK